ncbi:hypothetical protein [Nafulsella turpanensis]|uniref:hypothetical protein n=1 Tax=Nafulsella turpanensis TaxID=1265690 RepID=UPI00034DE8FC|nr:hypothetical protein [Nafulsella turpanensis]
MKNLLLLLTLVLLSLPGMTQNPDKVTMKNGTVYDVRIVEETDEHVHFYLLDDSTKEVKEVRKTFLSDVEYFKIPRKVNLINIIHPNLKGDELFKSVGIMLRDEGFVFENVDKDFWTLTTKPKDGKHSITYWFNVSVSGDKIIMSAYGDNGLELDFGSVSIASSKGGTRGENAGMKNSLINYPFEMMNTFARKYAHKNGGTIEYIRE